MINYMARPSVHFQMAAVIGGSVRIARSKDMEQVSGRMDRDTRGNTRRVRVKGMEYTNTQVELCIMENGNTVRVMVMGITGFQMAENTTESTGMIRDRERESFKRVPNYSESSMIKAILSAKLNSTLQIQNDLSYYKFTLY